MIHVFLSMSSMVGTQNSEYLRSAHAHAAYAYA